MTELLRGEQLSPETALPLNEVETLVSDSLKLGGEEQAARYRYFLRWVVCAVAVGLEVAAVSLLKGVPLWTYLFAAAGSGPVLAVGLGLGFSLAVGLAFPQRLPAYYDEYRVYGYNTGLGADEPAGPALQPQLACGKGGPVLGLPGRGGRGAPLADLAVWRLAPPEFYQAVWPFVMLALTLGGIFLPAMLAACLAGRRA